MNATAESTSSTNALAVRPPSNGAVRKIEHATRNQREFARVAGLNHSHVCKMLAGTRKPSFEVAARIAQIIGVSMDELYRYLVHAPKAQPEPVN